MDNGEKGLPRTGCPGTGVLSPDMAKEPEAAPWQGPHSPREIGDKAGRGGEARDASHLLSLFHVPAGLLASGSPSDGTPQSQHIPSQLPPTAALLDLSKGRIRDQVGTVLYGPREQGILTEVVWEEHRGSRGVGSDPAFTSSLLCGLPSLSLDVLICKRTIRVITGAVTLVVQG